VDWLVPWLVVEEKKNCTSMNNADYLRIGLINYFNSWVYLIYFTFLYHEKEFPLDGSICKMTVCPVDENNERDHNRGGWITIHEPGD